MPQPPYDHALNMTMQTVMTVALWSIAAGFIALAILRSLRQKTWFPIILVASVAFGSLIEPLYDISYHLLWFIPGQWTLFTSFDLPQPIWVMSAYIVVFAGPALMLCPKIEKGVSLPQLFRLAGITALTTAIFEIIAIQGGTYMYYGPHPFRLFEYPLWIAVLEACQITSFTIVAVQLRARTSGELPLLGLFVLFPANFCFSNLGAGFPGIIAMNMVDPPMVLVTAAAVLSMVFAAVVIWLVALGSQSLAKRSHAIDSARDPAIRKVAAAAR